MVSTSFFYFVASFMFSLSNTNKLIIRKVYPFTGDINFQLQK